MVHHKTGLIATFTLFLYFAQPSEEATLARALANRSRLTKACIPYLVSLAIRICVLPAVLGPLLSSCRRSPVP